MKQTIEFKREMGNITVVAGDFNTPLSILDRTTKQKISKDIEDLNGAINQLDLIDSIQ